METIGIAGTKLGDERGGISSEQRQQKKDRGEPVRVMSAGVARAGRAIRPGAVRRDHQGGGIGGTAVATAGMRELLLRR
jgi:hypothetical protein